MKKYFNKKNKNKKSGRWSDGFSNQKNSGKKDKKPGKNDDVEFENGTVLLIDEQAECKSITGEVQIFAIKGASLIVNGKKRI